MKRVFYIRSSFEEEATKSLFFKGFEVAKWSSFKEGDEVDIGCLVTNYQGNAMKGEVLNVCRTAGSTEVLVIGMPMSTAELKAHLIPDGYTESSNVLEKA